LYLLHKSLIVSRIIIIIPFHSAQPGGKLSQIQFGRKRKVSDYQSSNTNAASTLPTNKQDREDMAWTMCVLMMATRQLALINKTGQVDFEINSICRTYTEWLRNIVVQHFQHFFGANLFLSYDRVISGFLARQIASTFIATCARQYCECETPTEANTTALMDMETAPLTLQSCNLAIANALTHLVDTNLLIVNHIIKDKLSTPIIPPTFLMSIFGDGQIDMSTSFYDEIFTWLSQIVQNRQNEAEFISGYVLVPKLGVMEDYNAKEAYLESYFGVAKNNFFTYITAIRECATKTFNLSGFLCSDTLDFGRFMSRLGIGGDASIIQPQPAGNNNPFLEAHRSTYIFTQNAPQGGGISKCWVNIIQHLIITSIQGRAELHADNMFSFGANLTEFILSRCAPLQSIPAGVMVYESFKHSNDDVVPMKLTVTPR